MDEDLEMVRRSPQSRLRRSSKNLRTDEDVSPPRRNGTAAPVTASPTPASAKSLPGTSSHCLLVGGLA